MCHYVGAISHTAAARPRRLQAPTTVPQLSNNLPSAGLSNLISDYASKLSPSRFFLVRRHLITSFHALLTGKGTLSIGEEGHSSAFASSSSFAMANSMMDF